MKSMKPKKSMPRFSKLKDYLKNGPSDAPNAASSVTGEAKEMAPNAVLEEDDDIKSKGFKKGKNPFAKN